MPHRATSAEVAHTAEVGAKGAAEQAAKSMEAAEAAAERACGSKKPVGAVSPCDSTEGEDTFAHLTVSISGGLAPVTLTGGPGFGKYLGTGWTGTLLVGWRNSGETVVVSGGLTVAGFAPVNLATASTEQDSTRTSSLEFTTPYIVDTVVSGKVWLGRRWFLEATAGPTFTSIIRIRDVAVRRSDSQLRPADYRSDVNGEVGVMMGGGVGIALIRPEPAELKTGKGFSVTVNVGVAGRVTTSGPFMTVPITLGVSL